MNGKTGVRLLLIGTTIDITTKASRTSRRRRFTAESTCNCTAFVSVRSTSFRSSIPNDWFVGDHARHHFPTRFGSIDRSQPIKSQTKSQGNSRFHKQKCLIAIDTFRFIAFGRTRLTNFGSSIPNDLFVDDHKHLPFPTRSGSIDPNLPTRT